MEKEDVKVRNITLNPPYIEKFDELKMYPTEPPVQVLRRLIDAMESFEAKIAPLRAYPSEPTITILNRLIDKSLVENQSNGIS